MNTDETDKKEKSKNAKLGDRAPAERGVVVAMLVLLSYLGGVSYSGAWIACGYVVWSSFLYTSLLGMAALWNADARPGLEATIKTAVSLVLFSEAVVYAWCFLKVLWEAGARL